MPDSAFLTATGERCALARLMGRAFISGSRPRRPTARGRRPELPSEAQLRAVELDASTSSGRVCLLYAGGEGRAQVWFQDASCSWSFIASSFVDYFRLMVLHRGLPRWQYQYTDAGLDSVAKAWWRAFAADRCGSDTENRAQQVEYDVSRPAPFSWWHTFRPAHALCSPIFRREPAHSTRFPSPGTH